MKRDLYKEVAGLDPKLAHFCLEALFSAGFVKKEKMEQVLDLAYSLAQKSKPSDRYCENEPREDV